MLEKIDGKKTYVVGIAMLMYAIGGMVSGKLEITAAINTILTALGLMGIRHGINKINNSQC